MKKNNENEQIITVDFSDEFKKSYLDYSMSVITARAIPDSRDGLKLVQRRLLYDLEQLNVKYDRPTKKCARIVGDTMGKYHPHGDSSIYEALVVMSQPFKKSIPLVNGQGNLGSIEGDGAAAQRYTEAKLEKFTEDVLLSDLEQTVPFISNYDGTEREPEVLPARLPLLLINGSEGIAVGMTTNIPAHNVGEICDLCKAYISNPNMSINKMLSYMPGPDFPTGGLVSNKKDLLDIYKSGSGKIKIRGNIEYEKASSKKEHDRLVVTEIPYTMVGTGIEKFMFDVASLVECKKLPEIIDISNQSNKDGIRIVLEIKPDSDVERIKNILFKKTKLEDTFGVNMLAIHDGKPEILSLKDILKIWYSFQQEILTKKYSALLSKQIKKREIQEGLLKAYDCIDLIIEIIRGSKTVSDAKACLKSGDTSKVVFKTKTAKSKAEKLSFSDLQADSILAMSLQKLIGLEMNLLKKEWNTTLLLIEEYNEILNHNEKLNEIIRKDLAFYKKNYAKKRKTVLKDCEEIIYEEKTEKIDCYLLMDRFRYCKLIDIPTYERNKDTISSQYISCIKTTSESKLLIFTNKGTISLLKTPDIPLCKYKEKGEPIENLTSVNSEQEILHIEEQNNMCSSYIFVTKYGLIKKVCCEEFLSTKKTILGTKLSDNDILISILPIHDEKYLMLYTDIGYIVKLNIQDVPSMKKLSIGVKGIDTKAGKIEKAWIVNQTDSIELNNTIIPVSNIKACKRGALGKLLKKEED